MTLLRSISATKFPSENPITAIVIIAQYIAYQLTDLVHLMKERFVKHVLLLVVWYRPLIQWIIMQCSVEYQATECVYLTFEKMVFCEQAEVFPAWHCLLTQCLISSCNAVYMVTYCIFLFSYVFVPLLLAQY